jgi:transposase-like protein
MPRPKKYPDELRERAVRLVFDSQRPIVQVAIDVEHDDSSTRPSLSATWCTTNSR